jgi:hypothetical protein
MKRDLVIDIGSLLLKAETQAVEFKKSLSLIKEGCKSLCSMINSDWMKGYVLFGINPDGTPHGIESEDLDGSQRKLSRHVKQKFDPILNPTIWVDRVEGKDILILAAFREQTIPFYEYDGRAYIRTGSEDGRLSIGDKIRRIQFNKSVLLQIVEELKSLGSSFDNLLTLDMEMAGPGSRGRQRLITPANIDISSLDALLVSGRCMIEDSKVLKDISRIRRCRDKLNGYINTLRARIENVNTEDRAFQGWRADEENIHSFHRQKIKPEATTGGYAARNAAAAIKIISEEMI